MTVPDAWNMASPSDSVGADRRTVAVEPVASAIWQASVRCQISVYSLSWSAGTLVAISAGSRKCAPAGRIHSWASCAPAVFVAYCLGASDRILFAEMLDDRFAGGCDRLLRQRHRIGTHVGDVAVFVQALRRTHGLARAHAEAIAGGLLQGGRGERRHRTATVRLGFHRRDSETLRSPAPAQSRWHCSLVQAARPFASHPAAVSWPSAPKSLEPAKRRPPSDDHARLRIGNVVAIGVRRLQRGGDIPIRGTHERHALALAFHDQAGGHGLHAARGQARAHLAPQHRRQLIAVQTVRGCGGFPVRRPCRRPHRACCSGDALMAFLRDLVEHHALDRHLRLQASAPRCHAMASPSRSSSVAR